MEKIQHPRKKGNKKSMPVSFLMKKVLKKINENEKIIDKGVR